MVGGQTLYCPLPRLVWVRVRGRVRVTVSVRVRVRVRVKVKVKVRVRGKVTWVTTQPLNGLGQVPMVG